MIELLEAEMKTIELDILDEIHRICTDHGLYYYLAYGSLIGAARHNGFIPWDDDTDLLMFRSDYEQLVTHFDHWKSSERFALVAPQLGNCANQFAKVYDARTIVKQKYAKDEYTTGVWVDVFVLDDFDPDNRLTLSAIRLLNMVRYLAASNPNAPAKQRITRIARAFAATLFALADPKVISKRIDYMAKTQCAFPTNTVACIYDVDKQQRYVYQREWFSPRLMAFENRFYYAPQDYDLVLSVRYGDWRTPHPEEPHSLAAYML